MARNADDDVAVAIARRWESSVALVAAVPGNLERDRATEAQPNKHPLENRALPYAVFRVALQAEPDRCTANRAIHHHRITIEIRGEKSAVTSAAEILWYDPATTLPVFVRQPLLMDNANGNQAMAVLELGDLLAKDATTKDAADLWVYSHQLHVMTDRTY